MGAEVHFSDLRGPEPPHRWCIFLFAILGSLILIIVMLVATSDRADGATWYVDDDGEGDFTTIQSAIDDADDGDTIEVFAGIYNENLIVNKTVTLIGNGSQNTSIVGDGTGDVVSITANGVYMEAFRVSGSGGNPHAAVNVTSDSNTLTEISGSDSYWNGIMLYYSDGNTLINNTLTNTWSHNIYLKFSDQNTITNNNASTSQNGVGVYLYESHNNTLSGNEFWKNHYDGIWIERSHDNQMTKNRADENGEYGIGLDRSHRNSISWNNLTASGDHNLYLENSNFNILAYNNASLSEDGSGISLHGSDNNSITANDCWANAYTGIWMQGSDGDLIDENNAIENRNSGIGIDSSGNITIYANRCQGNGGPGIWLNLSHQNTIIGNNCSGSSGSSGIYLLRSNHNSLTFNTCMGNEFACIWMKGSDNNVIASNTCEENLGTGIGLDDSHHNAISLNTITGNKWGLYLGSSDLNTFSWNICKDSQVEGAYLYDASNNTLSENEFAQNNDGMTIAQSSADNTIEHNDIINNTEYGLDASKNQGVKVKAENNWWGDPTGPYNLDDNSDGEGDSASIDVDFTPWLTTSYNSPPVAEILLIDPEPALQGETLSLAGKGGDLDGAIVAYQWRSDIDGNLSDQASFTTDSLSPGDHVITFRVQDDEGLWSNSIYAALKINGKPVVNVTRPTPGAKVGKSLQMEGMAEDDGQVTLVEVAVDDGAWVPASGTLQWTFAWDLSTLKDGTHTIAVRAYDGTQYSDVVTLEVKVDTSDGDGPAPSTMMVLTALGLGVALNGHRRRQG